MMFIRNAVFDGTYAIKYFLMQNDPNPFRNNTTIKYSVAYKTKVIIIVINSDGDVVEKLISKEQEPGIYEIDFNGGNLPAGTYFYQLIAGKFSETRKMELME